MKIKHTAILDFTIRKASSDDVPLVLAFVKELAAYEKLSHEVVATEKSLEETLFGETPGAEVAFGCYRVTPVAFALFFPSYSTFLAKPGLYLEDLFVKPALRGRGFGKAMLAYLANLARERGCGRLEWSVLDWNKPAIAFYQSIGAKPMDAWTVQRIEGQSLDLLADRFAGTGG
jgi:GNAT superfamily N-acetyltransferase